MRFLLELQSPTGGSSGSMSVTNIKSPYYGDMYLWAVKSGADSAANGYVFAGPGARTHAVNHDTGRAAGTVSITDGTTATKSDVTNVSAVGPTLSAVDITCCADGTFTSALWAFTSSVDYELIRRQQGILSNYAAANEPLRDHWRITPDKIERGLNERMEFRDTPRIGLYVLRDEQVLQLTGQHQIFGVAIQWTARIRDYESPHAAFDEAVRLGSFLESVAFDEQRTWGGLVLNTKLLGRPILRMLPIENSRYGYEVIIQMICDSNLGQTTTSQNDSVSSTHGGRYASVTPTV